MSPMISRALINPEGHNFGSPNLDAIGVTYITLAVLYTIVIVAGLDVLWIHRHNEAVRLRGLAITFSAITTLHIYLLLVLAVYPENGLFACGTEFWIMSIALPFGQALFQACNVQVFSFSERQLRLVRCDSIDSIALKKTRFRFNLRGIRNAWNQLDIAKKTYVFIVFGVVSTLITTIVLFFGSRMFHSSWGLFGVSKTPGECRRGLEWIPSIVWQLIWTVIFGPYILYKIRNLHDVHSWAWQTRIAIICGLPGTPLWLLFTYGNGSAIAAVNKYWVPAMWFLPSLVSMQTTLWAIPVWEAVQNNRLRREEIAANAAAKVHHARPTSSAGSSTDMSGVSFSQFNNVITFSNAETLRRLQKYCAQVTMNGELVAFVRQVMDFQKKWENMAVSDEQHREMFHDAALIYFGLVNDKYADLPVNLPHSVRKELDRVFHDVRFSPFREDSHTDNVVTPWDKFDDYDSSSVGSDEKEIKAIQGDVLPVAGPKIQVPRTFDINVFKPSMEVIKQDIYNSRTFHRFFEHEQSIRSTIDGRSLAALDRNSGLKHRKCGLFGL